MKIRNGFVSNSSSSSFTIYGWTEKVFSEALGKTFSLLEGMDVCVDEYKIVENIEKVWEEECKNLYIICCDDESGCKVFGLGQYNTEIDHYIDDWQNFFFDEPSEDNKKKFDELAEKLGMPKPQMYKENFYE